jgi:hypothetical protein
VPRFLGVFPHPSQVSILKVVSGTRRHGMTETRSQKREKHAKYRFQNPFVVPRGSGEAHGAPCARRAGRGRRARRHQPVSARPPAGRQGAARGSRRHKKTGPLAGPGLRMPVWGPAVLQRGTSCPSATLGGSSNRCTARAQYAPPFRRGKASRRMSAMRNGRAASWCKNTSAGKFRNASAARWRPGSRETPGCARPT